MARTNQNVGNFETCGRCQGLVEDGQELCSSCGTPTRFMSFKARAEYEVEKWKQYKTQATA